MPLDVEAFEAVVEQQEALILDTRHEDIFKRGVHSGFYLYRYADGDFAPW